MRALVVADGDRPTRAVLDTAWPDWAKAIDLVVAVDGGVRLADQLGLAIDRWVGDGDSLGPEGLADLRERGLAVHPAPTAKDESDAELGLLEAVGAGATWITVVGGLGGPRPDHALANVLLLGHPAAAGRRVELLDPRARIRLLDADAATVEVGLGSGDHPTGSADSIRLDLPGSVGAMVSLLPLAASTGVTTTGLLYPLHDATLPVGPARGLSNVRAAELAAVEIRTGRLLVIEAPARLSV